MDIKDVRWPGWEVTRLIGSGSFGSVYEIQRNLYGNGEKAALKVISIPQNTGEIQELRNDGYDEESITNTFKTYMQSIINEYAMMRKMKGCTNIVDCDDVQVIQHEDGIGWDIYIKMELLTPMAETLPQDIPETTVRAVATDLCKALVLCKRFDIVHRDIKPQNVFISDLGDYKLGDFGVAKTIEKTTGGTKIGTYKYMAPEVYNSQPYGSAADIYSLGLLLYWMLNERRMPFMPLPPEKLTVSIDEQARARRLAGEPIPAPAHGSREMQAIVLKACAFYPKDRYASAEEMLVAVRALSATPVQSPVNAFAGNPPRQNDLPAAMPFEQIPVAGRLPYQPEINTGTVAFGGPMGAFTATPSQEYRNYGTQYETSQDATVGAFRYMPVQQYPTSVKGVAYPNRNTNDAAANQKPKKKRNILIRFILWLLNLIATICLLKLLYKIVKKIWQSIRRKIETRKSLNQQSLPQTGQNQPNLSRFRC